MTKHFITLTAFCLLFCAMIMAIALTSCNVTRTVTTSSQYSQRGDTTTTITTKTVESYNAVKK